MARGKRRNTLILNTSGFDAYAEKLEQLGADLKPIFEDALGQAAEKIASDTSFAMASSSLPAKGKYSTGCTEGTIIRDAQVKWVGTVGQVAVGFDFSKPGAGGFLIGGTPKMKPDRALYDIYKKKKYMTNIRNDIVGIFQDEINRRMGG